MGMFTFICFGVHTWFKPFGSTMENVLEVLHLLCSPPHCSHRPACLVQVISLVALLFLALVLAPASEPYDAGLQSVISIVRTSRCRDLWLC